MSEEEKLIVVPGEEIPAKEVEVKGGQGVYKKDDKYFAATPGLVVLSEEKAVFMPLESIYIPKPGDVVIGMVISTGTTYWILDIKAPYTAFLSYQELLSKRFNPGTALLSLYLKEGDYVIGKISSFDRSRNPTITLRGSDKFGKIIDGTVVEVKPISVPRIIGRKGSMLNLLVQASNCDMVVGMNGRVYVKCENRDMENVVALALKKIEAETHTSGLTDRIRSFLEDHIRGVKK
ncbi:MAG: exosome complex protein Rrp4 [Desulfurococcales archaeon]|nr:exosome complex protein Rrp4 [Desulfurococcales archaeon]